MIRSYVFALCFLVPILLFTPAHSQIQSTEFLSIKSKEVNMRTGPGKDYPTKVVYRCMHYPMKLIAKFEHWRLLESPDGDTGWIHQMLLTKSSHVVIKNTPKNKMHFLLYRFPNDHYPTFRVKPNSVMTLKKCRDSYCLLASGSAQGWIPKEHIWGMP